MGLDYESSHQDQKFKFVKNPDGSYQISCFTINSGNLFLEAYPQDARVRLKAQKQSQDQKFFIEPFSVGDTNLKRIYANTYASGIKSLEAYPGRSALETSPSSLHQDQQWTITRW